MIYIIIWAVVSYGNVTYANPEYHHTIVASDVLLPQAIDEIKKKGFIADYTVYRAYQCKVDIGCKEETQQINVKIPYLKGLEG